MNRTTKISNFVCALILKNSRISCVLDTVLTLGTMSKPRTLLQTKTAEPQLNSFLRGAAESGAGGCKQGISRCECDLKKGEGDSLKTSLSVGLTSTTRRLTTGFQVIQRGTAQTGEHHFLL